MRVGPEKRGVSGAEPPDHREGRDPARRRIPGAPRNNRVGGQEHQLNGGHPPSKRMSPRGDGIPKWLLRVT